MNTTQYIYIYQFPNDRRKIVKIGTSTKSDRVKDINKTFVADKPKLYKLYQFDIADEVFLSNGSRSKTIDDFFKSLFSSYRYIGDGGKEFYKISPQKAARLLSRNAKLFGGEEVADEEVAKSEIDKSTGKLTLKVAYDGLTLPDTFRFKKGQATGEMKVESGMFKVYKAKFGDISPTVTSMQPKDIKVLREQFKKDGVATFTSPSRAATFIYGQNINGKTDWKNEDKKTLIAVIQERTAKGN